MSKEEFVNNNRGIDDGRDLPRELLEIVFQNISLNEIKLLTDVDLFSTVEKKRLDD